MRCSTRLIIPLFLIAPLATFGCKGNTGPQGPAGDKGATGPAGPQGQAGTDGTQGAQGPQGPTGSQGPTGTPGQTGPQGQPGANAGDGITLKISFATVNGTAIASPLPAPGVYCFTNGFTGNSTGKTYECTSDAGGSCTMAAAGGTYNIQCRGGADYADPAMIHDLAAGQSAAVSVDRKNPLYFTTAPSIAPAKPKPGGQVTVNLGATSVPGAPITIAGITGLTTVSADAGGNFSVGTLDALLAGLDAGLGAYKAFKLPQRPGFVGLGDGVSRSLAKAYTVEVQASSGANTTKAMVNVPIGGVPDVQGIDTAPIGVLVIADGGVQASYAWTLTSKPVGSEARLAGASTRNPSFVPDLRGAYVLTEATGNTTLHLTAATYLSVASPVCQGCHGAFAAPMTMAEWWFTNGGKHGNNNYGKVDASGHPLPPETLFEWGLTGIDYSPTCFSCHTLGGTINQSPSVDNGGFYATMARIDNNGVFDPTKGPTENAAWVGDGLDHWSGLDQSLKDRAGIQCESCHGPLSEHAAMGGGVGVGAATPWNVKACAVCHDAPSHHDKVELWSKSAHAKYDLTAEATVENRGTTGAHCGRCHSAQGFATYVDQQQNGNAGPIVRPTTNRDGSPFPAVPAGCNPATNTSCDTPFIAYLSGMGLNNAEVENQNCQTCHNPHSTKLRVNGDTKGLAGGFEVKGAGAGAVCMICHNSRNGSHHDGDLLANVGAPHAANQTDMFAGKNAYFVGQGYFPSPHSAVGETCAGCHVKLVPVGLQASSTNHTFDTDDSICSSCHGAGQDLAGFKGAFSVARADLLANGLLPVIDQAIGAANAATYTIVLEDLVAGTSGSTPTTPGALPTAIEVGTQHGQAVLIMTVGGQKMVTKPSNIVVSGAPVIAKNGVVAKALWNVLLVSSQSFDTTMLAPKDPAANLIHNPPFAFDVLTATRNALASATSGF